MRLSASEVTHRFGQREPVLVDVSMDISRGETVALIGPSGSGKSTLLSILGGLLPPSSGSVEQDGHHTIHVAWVLQTTNALGRRTVFDNVALGLRAERPPRSEARSRTLDAIRSVGLAERAGAPAASLSGGELQRVSIARALVSDAPFIFADEPTGQLDHSTSRSVMDVLFGNVHRAGLVLATHDERVADRCDRVLAIVDGRLRSADGA